MIQIMEISGKQFKITITNMLSLVEKAEKCLNRQKNVSRKLKIVTEMLEIKTTMRNEFLKTQKESVNFKMGQETAQTEK
jgi:hypothetical protein